MSAQAGMPETGKKVPEKRNMGVMNRKIGRLNMSMVGMMPVLYLRTTNSNIKDDVKKLARLTQGSTKTVDTICIKCLFYAYMRAKYENNIGFTSGFT